MTLRTMIAIAAACVCAVTAADVGLAWITGTL
jgi:hypothetical protein